MATWLRHNPKNYYYSGLLKLLVLRVFVLCCLSGSCSVEHSVVVVRACVGLFGLPQGLYMHRESRSSFLDDGWACRS
jgi:hypothetical protein